MRRKTKKYNILRIVLNIVLSLILIVTSSMLVGMVYEGGRNLSGLKGVTNSETPNAFPTIKTTPVPNVINILICGVDLSEINTDIMMVVCYDSKRNTANIIQIPRDTYVGADVPTGKLNAVYGHAAKGESKILALERRLNSEFGLYIDKYFVITISGFRNLIDSIGGVQIDLPIAIKKVWDDAPGHKYFKTIGPGKVTLNGYLAEGFVRDRRGYASGADMARVEGQRYFFVGFSKKMKSLDLNGVLSLLNKCKKDFATDMTVSEIGGVAQKVKFLGLDRVLIHAVPGQAVTTRPPGLSQRLSYYSIHKQEYVDILNKYMRPDATTPLTVNDISVPEIYDKYIPSEISDGGSFSNVNQ